MTLLSGVFPVIPTPFGDDGAIAIPAFERLIDFALSAGVDGVVFPGMASEVETLTADERASLVAVLGRRVGGRVAIIVGASDADPARAAARAEEGRAAGARVAMVMAPAALKSDLVAHIAYFRASAAGTALPLMLQNAPPPNGAGLEPEAIAELVAAVPQLRSVKEETMPCGQHVTRILQSSGAALDAVFGGAGARYVVDELARGAAGTMPALELADVHVRLFQAWRRGDQAEARHLYNVSLPLLVFQAVFRVRATKAVLAFRGLLDGTHARAAGPRLDAGDRAELRALLGDARSLFLRDTPDLAV